MVPFQVVHHPDRPETEMRDCTVFAVATAARIPYTEAHALLKLAGRRDRYGFALKKFMAGRKTLGAYNVEHVSVPKITLAQFLRDFPHGRFLVRRQGHAFTVVNGAVRDSAPEGARRRIKDLWLLTERTI